MQYINPFSTLDISDDLNQIDKRTLQRLKKRYLAEFELHESPTIEIKEKTFDKNAILKIFNQLQNQDILNYHFKIFKNKPLLHFLENGNLHIFWHNEVKTLENESLNFRKFIIPYFSDKYSIALLESIKNKRHSLTKKLVKHTLFIPIEFESNCFQASYRYLTNWINDLQKLLKTSLKRKKVNQIFDEYIHERLNILPEYFVEVRIKLAEVIVELALKMKNEYQRLDSAIELIKIALSLKTSEYIRYRLQYILDQFKNYPQEYWGKGKPDDKFYVNKTASNIGKFFVFVILIIILKASFFGC